MRGENVRRVAGAGVLGDQRRPDDAPHRAKGEDGGGKGADKRSKDQIAGIRDAAEEESDADNQKRKMQAGKGDAEQATKGIAVLGLILVHRVLLLLRVTGQNDVA